MSSFLIATTTTIIIITIDAWNNLCRFYDNIDIAARKTLVNIIGEAAAENDNNGQFSGSDFHTMLLEQEGTDGGLVIYESMGQGKLQSNKFYALL